MLLKSHYGEKNCFWIDVQLKLVTLITFFLIFQKAEASLQGLDFSVAASKNLKSISVAYAPLKVEVRPFLHIGLGARSTVFFSRGASFVTAEASELRAGRMETFHLTDVLVSSTNAMFVANFELSEAFGLGFNLDLFGISFGKQAKLGNQVMSSDAEPSRFNVFIFDNYDHGSLNSQFLVSYKLPNNYKVSVGLAHQFVEYTSSRDFEYRNRRFRLKDNSLVLVLSAD